MDRMFQQHAIRKTFSLDGPWEYYFPREGTQIEPAAWAAGERRVMDVPGVWEMLGERKKYRGQAVARKVVNVPERGWLRLVFKGVSHTARVFFDGSEIGAGAIPGFRDPVRRGKWSEERQADILDEQLGCVLNHPRVGGVFVWQYCDVRVDEEWFYGRPRCMNNKGAVDEHRRPKLVFDVIERRFASKTAAGNGIRGRSY